MEPEFFGIEGIVNDDLAYRGSRFAEVRDAIFANPYPKVWGRSGERPLPIYEVTTRSVLRGVLPFGAPYLFRKATERAVVPTRICAGVPTAKAIAACFIRTAFA